MSPQDETHNTVMVLQEDDRDTQNLGNTAWMWKSRESYHFQNVLPFK